MKNKILSTLIVTSIEIFLIILTVPALAQVSNETTTALHSELAEASFSHTIDSKVNRNDTEIIKELLENSDHSLFLQNCSVETLFIMDLDQFRNGMAEFEVFGKQVQVLTKYELIDRAIPFYITIDGFNKKGMDCEAVVSIHDMNGEGKVHQSSVIKLSKSAESWEMQNLSK